MSGSLTTHVAGSCLSVEKLVIDTFYVKVEFIFRFFVCLPFANNIVDRLGDTVGVVIQTKVAEEHGAGKDHGAGVSLVLALDVQTDVTATRLEDGNITAHVAARDDTGTTNEGGTDVGQNATVQVRHDQHIELLGARDSLHGGVVDNHIVGLEGRVVLGNLVESAAEQTVGKLHDVGLVNASDLLAVVGQSEAESELGNALGLGASDNLQGLDNTLHGLVLQTGVLTLGVLTDNAKVDVLVAGVVTGDVLDQRDRGIDIQLLTKGNVERLVARALDGSVQDTLQTELVALERSQGLLEELLGVLVTGLDTAHIDLLPLNGHVVGLEDGLH